MSSVKNYLSLVTFQHTIFALPFALTSYFYAMTSNGIPFDWLLFVKVILCMVFARNAAMGFNRWADRKIDAANPRTANREIPAGKITPKSAMAFIIINAVLFVLCAWWINRLCLYLSPLALFIVFSYSLSKRYTAWAHIILGVSLAIAPVGAYIAVTGAFAMYPMLLAAAVLTWTSGFDILYSLQDRDFDREQGLHSIPARFSPNGATAISITLHVISVYAVWVIGEIFSNGTLYWIGAGLFVVLLIIQHIVYRPSKIARIGSTFGLVNGLASVTYAIFAIADMFS